MKEMAAALLLFTLMASVAVGSATSSRSDDSMNAFWEKFKTAVIKGDKEAVAGMSARAAAARMLVR